MRAGHRTRWSAARTCSSAANVGHGVGGKRGGAQVVAPNLCAVPVHMPWTKTETILSTLKEPLKPPPYKCALKRNSLHLVALTSTQTCSLVKLHNGL